MTALTARSVMNQPEGGLRPPVVGNQRRNRGDIEACGGAKVLDLALCLILAVTVVGLLLLAL
jgi:hypothetical protein